MGDDAKSCLDSGVRLKKLINTDLFKEEEIRLIDTEVKGEVIYLDERLGEGFRNRPV